MSIEVQVGEDSQIDFFTQSVLWTLGGGDFAGGHFKKSIFDKTNF